MPDEHPFAHYVRILARGQGRSRSLTEDEARAAMALIVAGEALPEQIGALLMLMRLRGESAGEVAGFVEALRAEIALAEPQPRADLDWPTYASGRNRGIPWFTLSALLLAEAGIRVFMHGFTSGHSASIGTGEALAALGHPPSQTFAEAAESLERHNFAFMPLRAISPTLQALIDLRPILGLRSAANTVARMLNPLQAPAVLQGVFHPPYRELQRQAAVLLAQPRLTVFKGGAGEVSRAPGKRCEAYTITDGEVRDEIWPPLLPGAEALRDEPSLLRDPAPLRALWRGDERDDRATAFVTGTAAIALKLLGRAPSTSEADTQARALWDARDPSRLREAPALARAGQNA